MNKETKQCQNCKNEFTIEPDDFAFYEKIDVPPPTWCPECRMIRRFLWRNERHIFRRKDSRSGKEIFSGFPPQVTAQVYELSFWNSDKWDPMEYGREYDFSKPFFEQFKELLYTVPWPAKSALAVENAEYCDQIGWAKNAYLSFNCGEVENVAYVVGGFGVKEGVDLYQSRHSELCYECYMVDEAHRVFFSVNCEDSHSIWFSKDMLGCSDCFGCVNLRNKQYYVFNEPYSKDAYRTFMQEFASGSYKAVQEMRQKAHEFWLQFPVRFTLAIKNINSTGEHIEESKNLKFCYAIHGGENLAYSQFLEPPTSNSYDFTNWGEASLMYESVTCGLQCEGLKFCWECWPSSRALEYCAFCRSSSDLFGCVGLKKKQYCIFNKQYTEEEYTQLLPKIKKHMNEMPYVDAQGRAYRYGEFFPPEFSPFAYNETLADDFFPLTKGKVQEQGYSWREREIPEHAPTIRADELPDNVKDVEDSILKEIITCGSCEKAFRLIPMELQFYRLLTLPLPRMCPDCRFRERAQFVNPPKFWHRKCMCAGKQSEKSNVQNVYVNNTEHFHDEHPDAPVGTPHPEGRRGCPNEFETSYKLGRPEIIYCEACYQTEVI